MCGVQGDRHKAHRLLMEANEVYQDVGDGMLGQLVQIATAWGAWARGDLREGLAILEDHLAHLRQTHFKWALTDALAGLTWMYLNLGKYAEALRMAEECFEVQRSTLIDFNEAWGHFHLGRVELALGNFKPARQRLEFASKTFHKIQNKWALGDTLNFLGLGTLLEGRLGEGLAQLEESRAFCERIENPSEDCVVDNLLYLGQAISQQGDFARAGVLIRQSLEGVWSANSLPRIPSRLEGLAAVASGQFRYHDSVILLGAADRQRQVMGMLLWPIEQPAYDELLSSLRAALGEAAFQQAWETGAALNVEQSVQYALEKTA